MSGLFSALSKMSVSDKSSSYTSTASSSSKASAASGTVSDDKAAPTRIAGQTMPKCTLDRKDEKADYQGVDNTWANGVSSKFNVRQGPNYNSNKKKAPSNQSLMTLVGVDCINTPSRIDNFGSNVILPNEWKDADTNVKGVPSLFIVNVQIPSEFPTTIFKEITDGPGYSIVFYYKLTDDTVSQIKDLKNASPGVKLFVDYCQNAPEVDANPDSKYRGKFKVIVNCDNINDFGLPSFITGYNAKPVLIRNTGTLIRGDRYIEMDINVHRFNSLAKKGLQALMSRFDKLYMDIGFCIESREDKEMPEVIFGCSKLFKPSTDLPLWN